MGAAKVPESPEVINERIYGALQQYQEAGVIEYVGDYEPRGKLWKVGYDGKYVKFTTREGAIGFLAGLEAYAVFLARDDRAAR